MVTPRLIQPIPGGKYRSEEVLVVKERPNNLFWVKNDPSGLRNAPAFTEQLFVSGKLDQLKSTQPLPVAVAVTETGTKQRPVLMVVGDSWYAANRNIIRHPPITISSVVRWNGWWNDRCR